MIERAAAGLPERLASRDISGYAFVKSPNCRGRPPGHGPFGSNEPFKPRAI
jgi:hypothetical protein